MMSHSSAYLIMSSLLIGFVVAWGIAVLQYPLVRWVCGAKRMRLSSSFWFTWGVLPILLGTFLAVFTFAFNWLRAVGWLHNAHTQHSSNPQLGLSQVSQYPHGGELFWAVSLACSVLVVAAAVRSYRKYLPTHQMLRGVFSADSIVSQPVSFAVVPSKFPLAFTAGLFFPRLYLTKAAVELLTGKERAVVESHEREHIRRRDPLRLFLFIFCEYWLPGVRHLRRQWQQMVEIECDRASMRSGFAPDLIGSTILKFEEAKISLRSGTMTLAYPAENTSNLRLRIESLFDEQPPAIGQGPMLYGCATVCLLLLVHFFEVNHELRIFLGGLGW